MNALAKKLLIKPGSHWLFYNAPEDYLELLDPQPEGLTVVFEPDNSTFNGIQLFAYTLDELAGNLDTISPLVGLDTVCWICYPKKSSGIVSDINMMDNYQMLSKHHLEVVASASVNDIWSAFRVRIIGQAKKSKTANADIKQNDYSAYIDVENRKVYLPADVEAALKVEPKAFELYNRLAYSHQKEYVLWILTAKQEKTRNGRLVKMVSMLLDNKRNPGDQ